MTTPEPTPAPRVAIPDAINGFAFVYHEDGLDLDTISDSIDNVRIKCLQSTMGWRFNHPDLYSHDEKWNRLLTYGKVVAVKVAQVDGDGK